MVSLNFQFSRIPLNADLPYPPEAAPFCLNVTEEWLIEEGYNPAEWTIYKGIAFRGTSSLVGGIYKGEFVLHFDGGERKSKLITKRRVDEITDLSEVSQFFIENGYVLDHAVGHNHARENFLGCTINPHWQSRMDWDAAASRSRKDWWDMLPPCITQPVVEFWLKKHTKEVEERIESLKRWEREAIELKQEFPDLELIYKEDEFLKNYPDLENPPRYVSMRHSKLPFELSSARTARKYLSKV